MIILKLPIQSNGTYVNQSCDGETVPDGYVAIPNELLSAWEQYKPFVTLTIIDGVIIAIDDNSAARITATMLTTTQIRENKLNSLNGMCSGVIYQGIDIGTLHYNFSDKTQVNLETIARMINDGQITFLYRADNETEQRNYTADEMKVIIKTKSEWITLNTNYYELLKQWVNRETDVTIIEGIHYGLTLPNDLMQELITKLTSVGIDITKYATMLGGE